MARADAPPAGVVVVVGAADAAQALAAAEASGGAAWRLERLVAAAPRSEPEPPRAALESLRAAYLEADFLRCLTRLQDPELAVPHLLEAGHRAAAAQAGVFGAACAFGAQDAALARGLLESVFVAELDPTEALGVTTPDFQALAESVRVRVIEAARVAVTIRTRPSRASVQVDGGSTRCAATPCVLSLLAGEHVLSIGRLGYSTRVVRERFEQTTARALSLDPASETVVRSQLADTLAGGRSPGEIEISRAAASAFEVRVVVVAWSERDRVHAAVYDRARDGILARISSDGSTASASAVRSVVSEWRGITEPTPLYAEPLFWATTIGVAVLTGLTMYLLLRPGDTRYDIVFTAR